MIMGQASGNDAANLLKPPLARGQIKLIGATTEEEYTKYLEKDKALERRFERIKIEEPNYDDAVRIVNGVIPKYKEHHNIEYTPESLTGAVKFAMRYLGDRNLPDVALDVIDEAGSEFGVKEEYAKKAIPELEKNVPDLEKMFAGCGKKDQDKDPEAFEKLRQAYEDFARGVGMIDDYWGHRVEVQSGDSK